MKKWNTPVVTELEINKTEENWTGKYTDGGHIGDGELNGHLTYDPSASTGEVDSFWDWDAIWGRK